MSRESAGRLYLQRLPLCYIVFRVEEFFIIFKDLESQENRNASESYPFFTLPVFPTPKEQHSPQQCHPLAFGCNARPRLSWSFLPLGRFSCSELMPRNTSLPNAAEGDTTYGLDVTGAGVSQLGQK